MSLVVPAVLPSSKKDLEEKLELLSRLPSVRRVQIDVVDGKFASPASWPYNSPAELRDMIAKGELLPHLDNLEYEIDLMCLDAEQAAGAWLALGASRLTFHAESATDLPRFLASARAHYGPLVSFGLALNIASDLSLIEPCLDLPSHGEVEYVQFMGIAHIGRQAEPFDPRVLNKVRVFHNRHPDIAIQVDGGVSLDNAKELLSIGVSNLIVGSSILRASDPAAAVAAFEELESPFGV